MSSGNEPERPDGDASAWRFLSNHSQVLLCIDRDPNVRLRDVAETVGITERAVQRIVGDLVESGYLNIERIGRRNHYTVTRGAVMRHPAQTNTEIGELLDLLTEDAGPGTGA
jgi:predicted ArsR family transcriptional regulator